MIARLQQLIVLSLLIFAATLAVVLCKAEHPWWALGAVAVIALGHIVFIGLEFFLLTLVVRQTPNARSSAFEMFRAWLGEALHAPRTFCWRQPFRSHKWPDSPQNAGANRRGVVLVHGMLCNRGFWNPWMVKLHAEGTPFVAINLEPIGGLLDGDISALETAVSAMEVSAKQLPVLVGHSRGGLVLRAWAAMPGNLQRIQRIITVGTPHGGTWMARFATSSGSAEMRIDSPWLTGLRARETTASYALFTCFYSRCDNVVFPAPTATLTGADNREIAACAHIQMAFRPEVFAEVKRWLADDATRTPTPSEGASVHDQKSLSLTSTASGAISADSAMR